MSRAQEHLLTVSLVIILSTLISACGGSSSEPNAVPTKTSSLSSINVPLSSAISSLATSSLSSPPVVLKPVELKHDTLPDPVLPTRASADWNKAVDASRFLAQASYGATAKDIDYIIKQGKSAWLEKQVATAQTSQLEFLDKRLIYFGYQPTPPVPYFDDQIESLGVWRRYIMRTDIWWETAIWGQDQLRQRVAFALSQILVVSEFGADQYARERGFANYHDILAKHALGNYESLLTEISLNPIMGIYLSSLNNPKANEQLNIRPDENYAREILQLFSIGLNQLNNDGSLKLDSHGNAIPTYDQNTVKEFSRIFTGWSSSRSKTFGAYGTYFEPVSNTEPMKAYPAFHDSNSKTLLNGEIIPAGNSPQQDIQAAIKNIVSHPNTGPFIGKKLIQYLVTSNPSPEYVARISSVFNDNGAGIKGDMKAVIMAIYLDDEAQHPPVNSQTYYGKLKEYPLLVSGIWRAFKARGIPIKFQGKSLDTIRYMSRTLNAEQEAFFAPSVFNFYQSDYSPPGKLAQQKLLAPEFQMFTESNAVLQANLLAKMIYNRDLYDKDFWGTSGQNWGTDTAWNNPPIHAKLNLAEEIAIAGTPLALVDRLNLILAQGNINNDDANLIANHIALISDPLMRVYEAVFLIAVSPEYAIQR